MKLSLYRSIATLQAVPVSTSYRIKIPLPSAGECWFTVNKDQDLNLLVDEIKAEDSLVASIQTNSPTNLPLSSLLNQGPIDLKINGTDYVVQLSALSSRELETGVLKSFVDSIAGQDPHNKEQLRAAVKRSLMMLGEQTSAYLTSLNTQLAEVEKELKKLEALEKKMLARARLRVNLGCLGFLSLFCSQWGFFYYTIYEVEWLGWDLMEPITYSVGQGGFVMGVLYFTKNKIDSTYSNLMNKYQDKKKSQLSRKFNLDVGRLSHLRAERERLQSQIKLLEQRLTYGI